MKTHALLLILTVSCLTGVHAQDVVIARHFGATDPVAEGFTLSAWQSAVVGPVFGDHGVDAWSLFSPSASDLVYYRRSCSEAETQLLSQGWTLSMTLRILAPEGEPAGNFVQFGSSGLGFFSSAYFSRQPDGDPRVRFGWETYDLEGLGDGYHTYQLRYAADTGLTSFSVDGSLLVGGLSGGADLSNPVLSWGLAQRPPGGPAASNWREVTLSAIPEPSAAGLLALGLGGVLAARRQRRWPTGSDIPAGLRS
jgi:hypothetical protein